MGRFGGNRAALKMNIFSLKLESEVGMFVNLLSHVATLFFSLPLRLLPSSTPPSVHNHLPLCASNQTMKTMNLVSVSFSPSLTLPHLACPLLLTHGDPASYSLAHANNQYLTLFLFLSFSVFYFSTLYSDILFSPSSFLIGVQSFSICLSLSLSLFLCDFMLQLPHYQSV